MRIISDSDKELYNNKILDFIKNFKLKNGYICVNNGYIFTIDGISIKFIQDDSAIFNYVGSVKYIDDFMFVDFQHCSENIVKFTNLYKIYNDMSNKFFSYMRILNSNQFAISEYSNFQTNEDFIRINSLKSADGAKSLMVGNHLIYLFKGLIPLNKNDTMDLTIYELEYSTDLFNFKIYKKKKPVMNMIICCLNPNR